MGQDEGNDDVVCKQRTKTATGSWKKNTFSHPKEGFKERKESPTKARTLQDGQNSKREGVEVILFSFFLNPHPRTFFSLLSEREKLGCEKEASASCFLYASGLGITRAQTGGLYIPRVGIEPAAS